MCIYFSFDAPPSKSQQATTWKAAVTLQGDARGFVTAGMQLGPHHDPKLETATEPIGQCSSPDRAVPRLVP